MLMHFLEFSSKILAGLPKYIQGAKLRIDKFSFGKIKVNGKEYRQDVFVTNESVEKRQSSHTITRDDIDKALLIEPDFILIGKGTTGRVEIPEEIRGLVAKNNIELIEGRTTDVIEYFNKLKNKSKIVGIFHLTC